MMKQLLFFVLFFLLLCGCRAYAQAYKIFRLHAFSQSVIPGNIPVEETPENGFKGHAKRYFIYLESNSPQMPVVKQVWINKVAYEPSVFKVENNKTEVGKDVNEKRIHLQASKGRFLYKIELEPVTKTITLPANYKNIATNKMLLQVLQAKKNIYFTTPAIQEVTSDVVY